MKKFNSILIVLFVSFSCNIVFAASPLVKASFYEAYQNNEMVQYAEKLSIVDGKIAFYLMDENINLGEKAAVINALNWNENSKNNADTYKMFLGRKYGVGYESLDFAELSGDELLCLGYIMLLVDNKNITEATGILNMAIEKNTQSYITNLIYALASAQIHLNDGKDCDAWTICNSIRTDAAFTKDVDDQALEMIYLEVDAYKDSCK